MQEAQKHIHRLIGRAIRDTAFRKQLAEDPQAVLKAENINLNPETIDKLKLALPEIENLEEPAGPWGDVLQSSLNH